MTPKINRIHFKFAFFNCAIITLIVGLLFYAVNAPSKSITIQVSDFDIKNYKGFAFSENSNKVIEPKIVELVLKKGDNLFAALQHIGASKAEASEAINAILKKFDLKKFIVGHKLTVQFLPLTENNSKTPDAPINLLSISFKTSKSQELIVQKNERGNFEVSLNDLVLNKKLVRVSTIIEKSFFEALAKSDLSNQVIKDISNAFSYDLDFQRDIRKGNKIDLLYEKFYDANDSFTHVGNVIYAALTLSNNKKYEIYRFTKRNGHNIFLSAEGRDTKKDLLKTPIHAARISSKFGMRMHPVHGYYKNHTGIDFAARIGTPIVAAGNGIVKEIGYKNGYGRYIKLEHNKDYSTAYGHISKFAKGLKKGDKVKQGEIIAYVGNTGTSTGAHLHFEVLHQGRHVNPIKVKSTPGEKLSIAEMKIFKQHKEAVLNVMKSVRTDTKVAYEFINNSQKLTN